MVTIERKPVPVSAWDEEDAYWERRYSSRPYVAGSPYAEWRPAYRFGFDAAQRYLGRQWNEIERELEHDWDTYPFRGDSRSTWEEIKDAAHDAWKRVTCHS